MEILCLQCRAPLTCQPEGGCWCADLPHALPVPDSAATGCLCRDCLTKKVELQVISSATSRLDHYFPQRQSGPAMVLLVNPAQTVTVPPLDLLKLSTFLRRRGYVPVLQNAVQETREQQEPYAVVLTTVFSWDIPALRQAVALAHNRWPTVRTILMGVLPRKFGDSIQSKFGVSILDEHSESLLDEETPDYVLAPDWNASILITSKGVCPRECSHCETAAKGKGVTKLITRWYAQLNHALSRVEVWDNTLMLTPREHYSRVAERLKTLDKPVDFVCGLTPGGVDEVELHWRINELAGVKLLPARLECNQIEDLPRFSRLLAYTRRVFGDQTCYRSFAVVNGTESPSRARERITQMKAEGVEVDIVCFTPHDWEESQPYVNSRAGWTAAAIESLMQTS